MEQMNHPSTKSSLLTPVVFCLVLAAFIFLHAGCATVPKSVPESHEQFEQPPEKLPEITLSPGDEIEIQFFYTDELSTTQTVRPDGIISLKLIGDLYIEGKTPTEVKQMIKTRLSKHISQIDVTIVVRSINHRRVYVGGAVAAPGVVPMPGRMTALEALMMAGGLNFATGTPKTVLIIRNVRGEWTGGRLNVKDVLKGKTGQPFYLQPQDIVFVPEKRVVAVNRWLDQNIGSILPAVGFSYNINPDGDNFWSISTEYDVGGTN